MVAFSGGRGLRDGGWYTGAECSSRHGWWLYGCPIYNDALNCTYMSYLLFCMYDICHRKYNENNCVAICQVQAPVIAGKELFPQHKEHRSFCLRQTSHTVGFAAWLTNMFFMCVSPKINSEEDSAWWLHIAWHNGSEQVGGFFYSWKGCWRMKPNSHCNNCQ